MVKKVALLDDKVQVHCDEDISQPKLMQNNSDKCSIAVVKIYQIVIAECAEEGEKGAFEEK